MSADPVVVCELLVGLEDVDVMLVEKDEEGRLYVHIQCRRPWGPCEGCGGRLHSKSRKTVVLKDKPDTSSCDARLMFHKQRVQCLNPDCGVKSFTMQRPDIAAAGSSLTTRAAEWMVEQAAAGHTVDYMAMTMGCGWGTAMKRATDYGGALLEADTARVEDTSSMGVDETLMAKEGEYREKRWITGFVDTDRAKLLGVVEGRTSDSAAQYG